MTLIELPRDIPADLSLTEKRARARAELRADPELTGAEVARRYGMPEDWGRKQRRAVRGESTGASEPFARTGSGTGVPSPVATNGTARPAPDRTGVPVVRARRAARPKASGGTSVPMLMLAACAFGLVAAVCAFASYVHVRDLAEVAGMGNLSAWLPLGVDGLVVACSCSLLVDRSAHRPGSLLAWAGVALGLVGSVAANVLAVDPNPISQVLAAYPPIALAVSGHLLLRMVGER